MKVLESRLICWVDVFFFSEVERTIVAIDVLGSYHQARAEGEWRDSLSKPRKNLIRHEAHVKDSFENEICFYEPFDQLGHRDFQKGSLSS